MEIKDKLTEDFLEGIQEIEKNFLDFMFLPFSFEKKGFAYYIQHKRGKTTVEFLFGPSDWDVEIIIFTSKGKFAFKDLLQIPVIAKWVNDNIFKQENGRNVKKELQWCLELL